MWPATKSPCTCMGDDDEDMTLLMCGRVTHCEYFWNNHFELINLVVAEYDFCSSVGVGSRCIWGDCTRQCTTRASTPNSRCSEGRQGGRLGVDDKHFAGERFKFYNTVLGMRSAIHVPLSWLGKVLVALWKWDSVGVREWLMSTPRRLNYVHVMVVIAGGRTSSHQGVW